MRLLRFAIILGALTAAGAVPVYANAAGGGADQAVFVQTNSPSGNAILAYHRSGDGSLHLVATYPTGGTGGAEAGSVVDPLASLGSLTYDAEHGLLLAANAGSDTISVFRASGDTLTLVQVVPSGGSFPTSIAVGGGLAYVLDAGLAGTIQGYRIADGRLHPIVGSSRSLGLSNASPPNFLSSPGQIGFTPDGSKLVVTTKLNGGIDVFRLSPGGRPSASPVVTASAGPVPFAFTFDPRGRLIVTEAGSSSLSSYVVRPGGALHLVDKSVPDGQSATCWIVAARGHYYVSNTGSGNLSGYDVNEAGKISLIGGADVAATTDPGPVDSAVSEGGRFVYVESGGAGVVDVFGVSPAGSLTSLGSVAAVHGLEGIVAF